MIATITDVILARFDEDLKQAEALVKALKQKKKASQSRKNWKKIGEEINTRKRQRRKAGAMKTAYTAGDYKWVTNTINQYQKNGISLIRLWKISSEKPQNLTKHKHRGRRGLRSELPPGRDKISQIVADGNGKDWKVTKSAGGRGKPTVILPIQPDEIVAIERLGLGFGYRTMVERLKLFRKMGNVLNRNSFNRNDFFQYAALKDEMLGFPMKIFLTSGRAGSDKSSIFNAVVSGVQIHLKTMRKIEEEQKSLDMRFPEILKDVQKLRTKNVESAVFKIPTKDLADDIVQLRNTISYYFASF